MDIEVNCPKCGEKIYISEINCSIFRHAVFKKNFIQINPHSTKEECDKYLKNNETIGCCSPFKIIKNDENIYIAILCDYI